MNLHATVGAVCHLPEALATDEPSPHEPEASASRSPPTLADMPDLVVDRIAAHLRARDLAALELSLPRRLTAGIAGRLSKLRCLHDMGRLSTPAQVQGALAAVARLAPEHRVERLFLLGRAIQRMPRHDQICAKDALEKAISELPRHLKHDDFTILITILAHGSAKRAVSMEGYAEAVGRVLDLPRSEIEELERIAVRGVGFHDVMIIGSSVRDAAAEFDFHREDSIRTLEEYALVSPRFRAALGRGASAEELQARFGLRDPATLDMMAYLIERRQVEPPLVEAARTGLFDDVEDIARADLAVSALRTAHARARETGGTGDVENTVEGPIDSRHERAAAESARPGHPRGVARPLAARLRALLRLGPQRP
jgi:hypothetical protein